MGDQPEKLIGGCTGKGFLPGQSGNPGGRPKGQSLTATLREMLQEPDPAGTEPSAAEAIVRALIRAGILGNSKALRQIFDRADGPVRQQVEISGPEGGPIPVSLAALPAEDLDALARIADRLADAGPGGGQEGD